MNSKQLIRISAFPFLILPILMLSLNFSPQHENAPCKIDSKKEPQVCIYEGKSQRVIESNGLPDHPTGNFPNKNNPNRIKAQRYKYSISLTPKKAKNITAVHGAQPQRGQRPKAYKFGVALNGIPFDPGAGEFWFDTRTGRPNRAWQMEALNAELGIDQNNAHVQPTGAYHYHGVPNALVKNENSSQHSNLLGYAADGFPIYYKYAYKDPMNPNSEIVALQASYQLKSGQRPGDGKSEPNGTYDGTFVRDFEYVATLSELDECNGRFGITPEYPNGTYYYVLTDGYPWIPRCFSGTPSTDFELGPPPGDRNNRPPNGPGGRRPFRG